MQMQLALDLSGCPSTRLLPFRPASPSLFQSRLAKVSKIQFNETRESVALLARLGERSNLPDLKSHYGEISCRESATGTHAERDYVSNGNAVTYDI